MPDSRRIQFEFSVEAMERLDALRAASKASSYAEVVRDAVRLYEWYVTQRDQGFEIGLLKDEQLVKVISIMF